MRQHFIAHADAADAAAFEQPQEPSGRLNVLPRLKESDPFKILGIPNDSDFEEVQAARNYLVEVRPAPLPHLVLRQLVCA